MEQVSCAASFTFRNFDLSTNLDYHLSERFSVVHGRMRLLALVNVTRGVNGLFIISCKNYGKTKGKFLPIYESVYSKVNGAILKDYRGVKSVILTKCLFCIREV